MGKKTKMALGALAAIGGLYAASGLYVIDETEQAVVTQLGRPTRIIVGSENPGHIDEERIERIETWARNYERSQGYEVGSIEVIGGAGIRWRLAGFNSVHQLPDTNLRYNANPEEVQTKDKRQLLIDNYAIWEVENPLLYYNKVNNVATAKVRLEDIIYSVLRVEIGKYNLHEIIRTESNSIETIEGEIPLDQTLLYGRENILKDVLRKVNEGTTGEDGEYIPGARGLGINVLDVSLIRAELLKANQEAVFNRMSAERQKIADLFQAQGTAEDRRVRAETDRRAAEISSVAETEALTIRGEADAEATRLYVEAMAENPEFFQFWQTLKAYEAAFGSGNTTVVMDAGSEFNKFLSMFGMLDGEPEEGQ